MQRLYQASRSRTPVTPALRRLNGLWRATLLAGLAKSNLERILVTPLFVICIGRRAGYCGSPSVLGLQMEVRVGQVVVALDAQAQLCPAIAIDAALDDRIFAVLAGFMRDNQLCGTA